jgi:hypothetical protein
VKRKRKRQWVPTVSSQTADGRQGSTLAASWLPSFQRSAAHRVKRSGMQEMLSSLGRCSTAYKARVQ